MSFLPFTLSVKRNHSPCTRVMDGVASLAEVISNRFVSPVFYARKKFFEAGVKGASSFAYVELSAFSTTNDVCNVVRQVGELFRRVRVRARQFIFRVFTCRPGESYSRRFFFAVSRDVFVALVKSLC